MATLDARKQVLEQLGQGTGDGNITMGRHSYYGTLYLGTEPVGGMQAWNLRETNGTQFIPNAGNDWLEPRFGMRMWQGQGSRFQIRGADFQDILAKYYTTKKGNPSDVDFRFMPFNWLFHFHMSNFEQGANFENTNWYVGTVWVTEYTWKYTSPMDLIYEDFSFIAKGVRRVMHDGTTLGNPIYLWGVNGDSKHAVSDLENNDIVGTITGTSGGAGNPLA